MKVKEILQIKRLVYQIKLDNSENDFLFFSEQKETENEKAESSGILVNEWNQEYELIYSSYVLDN